MRIKVLLDRLTSCFYPGRCPYCNTIITPNSLCCEECAENITQEDIISKEIYCSNVSPFRLDGMYKNAIYSMKFSNRPGYAKQLAMPMVASVKKIYGEQLENIDYVAYVPTTKKSLHSRGYNQAYLLAKYVAMLLDIPCKDLLLKIKENDTQHLLTRKKRKHNVENVFGFNNRYNIKDKNVLVIDDIYTTGSTLNECARVLLDSGAGYVLCTTYVTAVAKNRIENDFYISEDFSQDINEN